MVWSTGKKCSLGSAFTFHEQGFTRACFECGPGRGRAETPELSGRKIAVNLAGRGLSLDAIKRNGLLGIGGTGPSSLAASEFRNWKGIDKLGQCIDVERRGHGGDAVGLRDCMQQPAFACCQSRSQQA